MAGQEILILLIVVRIHAPELFTNKHRGIMIIAAFFYSLYAFAAAATTWLSFAIVGAHLDTHPKTRDLKVGWLAYPLAVILGSFWPFTIALAIIVAGVTK